MNEKYTQFLEKIENSQNVIIMSHKNIDLDALGSSLGCFNICKTLNKNSYIMMEENIHDNVINETLKYLDEAEYHPNFIGINEINSVINENTLLIIVDVSNKKLFSNESLLSIKNKIIVDHHILREELDENIFLIHDVETSSACEIITDICRTNNIKLDEYASTIMLGGIIIDTTHYKYKVGVNTFETSKYLLENNASMNIINNLTQINLSDFLKFEEVKKNAILINDNYLIAYDKSNIYKQSNLSVISKDLLLINDVYMSIVIGHLENNVVGMSINSINNYDANKLACCFNGGGHNHAAAAQIENGKINEIFEKLKTIIEKENLYESNNVKGS